MTYRRIGRKSNQKLTGFFGVDPGGLGRPVRLKAWTIGRMSRLHTPKAGFWIRLCVVIIYPLCGLWFRIRWHHLDRMPARGGVIVVINHISYIDTLLMARLIWQTGRIPRFMIKSDVFSQPVLGAIMRGA